MIQSELNEMAGKIVMVKLRDGTTVRGVLKSFDQHMNLLLEDSEEIIDPKTSVKRGMVMIRGDTVLFVSPL
ncbi:small nuclear ribonucleoprotein (Sm) [Thermocladium modestius]|uniref:Putative snRNP Sm-like protein n=2 Tax=Thermocladium modestius TaxID=62609 RepID=A0A830GVT6_9CREN|nr:small nuclear ribonucleoprotein (Sm) [Thermocladium modestius]